MSVTAITLGNQTDIAGITVPVTVSAATRPAFIQASFSDQVYNLALPVNKQITNFVDISNGEWSAEAILSESDMFQLFPDGDFTKKVRLHVYKGAVNGGKKDLVWKSAVELLSATAVPGSEKITVTVELSPKYINEDLIAQVSITDSSSASDANLTGVQLTPVQVAGQPSKTRFTCEVTHLVLGKEYEVQVSVENLYGSSNSLTLNSIMTSLNPGAVSINSFDSLDVSGAVFDFTVAAFDYSAYKSLKLLLDFKKNDASAGSQQSIIIDICGVTNPAGPNSNQSFDMNRIIMSSGNKTAIGYGPFDVDAKLEGVIAIDASGLTERTYTGVVAKKSYIMDQNMGNAVVTLDEIDWVSGAQTVKAVIDGCFNEMTFKFDLSGAESTTTTYDICANTQKMTATKIYSYSELNQVGKYVKVSASRPELNGSASVSTSGTVSLAYNLKAVKRALAPTVAIDFKANESDANNTDTTFAFTNIPDLSYSDVFGRVKGENVDVEDNDTRDNSGNATITLTETFVAGARYVASGHSRFNLDEAGFNVAYKGLNENSPYLLSAAVESQIAYKGTPVLELAVRPLDICSNELKVVRMSGDMKANDVSELLCFARDVCGNILQRKLAVNADSVDSCGNNLSGNSENYIATTFAHDFVFDKEIEIGSAMFLVGIIDTPNSFDAINTKMTPAAAATTFKTAADAYNAAVNSNALDLSNNPLNDTAYAGYVGAIANYDISLANLTADISAAILVRDGSANGSVWFASKKADELTAAAKKLENAAFNLNSISNASSLLDMSMAEFETASERNQYNANGSVSFGTRVYVSPTDDASSVVVTFTGTATSFLENQFDIQIPVFSAAHITAIGNNTAADTAKNAADEANADIDTLISTKEGLKTTATTNRATAVTNRDSRAQALVSAAATAGTVLINTTQALETARLAFFPAPVVE